MRRIHSKWRGVHGKSASYGSNNKQLVKLNPRGGVFAHSATAFAVP